MARTITYPLTDLLELLLQTEGITLGHWEVGVNLDVEATTSARAGAAWAPTLVVRVVGLNLVEKPDKTPSSVDAASLPHALRHSTRAAAKRAQPR